MMMMAIYVKFMEGIAGLTAAMIGVAILSIILGAIVCIVLESPKKQLIREEQSNIVKDFMLVGKNPATWLVAILVFSIYSFLTTLTYFTPYFTNVLGVTIVFTGWVAILRQHGMTLLGAPIGGFLSDWIKSPSKVLVGVQVLGVLGFILLLTVHEMSAAFIIALTLILSAAVYIGRGSYYATITEAGIPRELTASTIGIAAAVGFSPDLFQFTLFGYWLDIYGNAAYAYMFIFQGIVLIIGTFAAIGILRLRRKNRPYIEEAHTAE